MHFAYPWKRGNSPAAMGLPDELESSSKNQRAARDETRPMMLNVQVLGHSVTFEVRSMAGMSPSSIFAKQFASKQA